MLVSEQLIQLAESFVTFASSGPAVGTNCKHGVLLSLQLPGNKPSHTHKTTSIYLCTPWLSSGR